MQTLTLMSSQEVKTRGRSRVAAAACWGCHVGEKLLGASAATVACSVIGHQSLEALGMRRWKSQQLRASAGTIAKALRGVSKGAAAK